MKTPKQRIRVTEAEVREMREILHTDRIGTPDPGAWMGGAVRPVGLPDGFLEEAFAEASHRPRPEWAVEPGERKTQPARYRRSPWTTTDRKTRSEGPREL